MTTDPWAEACYAPTVGGKTACGWEISLIANAVTAAPDCVTCPDCLRTLVPDRSDTAGLDAWLDA